jgi:O-acetyl-ADP-ribose deacetylase
MELSIISDSDVIRYVANDRNTYALWLGAGASREARIITADEICLDIRKQLEATRKNESQKARERWAADELKWNDAPQRYTSCIVKGYPQAPQRVNYFRSLLDKAPAPAFCHHATAILMRAGVVKRTCLTTNFDQLIESAFVVQGVLNCTAIRTDSELPLWNPMAQDSFFVLKLHGDISTKNILNTTDETIFIPDGMASATERLLRNSGVIVIGAGGQEGSVSNLFQTMEKGNKEDKNLLNFGVLWGVYMGQERVELSKIDLDKAVAKRIKETNISRLIVELAARKRGWFNFFPLWGAGNFLEVMVEETTNRELRETARRFYDHDMRLRKVFAGAGLSPLTVSQHLSTLRTNRDKAEDKRGKPRPPTRFFARALVPGSSRAEILFLYGDISSRSLLSDKRFTDNKRGAVVSAEDVHLSVGGGVALTLVTKAGAQALLHELSKFKHVRHCSVTVTSGGNLPVHYIFHAAALRIEDGPDGPVYRASRDDVKKTLANALNLSDALNLTILWVPLLGTGVARLPGEESLMGLLEAIRDWSLALPKDRKDPPLTIPIVIYNDAVVTRESVERCVHATLGKKVYVPEEEMIPAN